MSRVQGGEYRRQLRRNGIQAAVFVAVTALFAAGIGLTFARVPVGDHENYRAVFDDVSGLTEGSEVRAAGVSVGRVEKLALQEDTNVVVTFSVADEIPMTSGTRAQVRYANLTGDRFLQLSDGDGSPLAPGATLPVANTAAALDLDTLFNGFRPLTRSLDPQQVNALTSSIIAVSQGQGGALETLLSRVASVTTSLADHDALIGEVIDNLSEVLGTVDSHESDLDDLIVGLHDLTDGLAKDREVVGDAIVDIDAAAARTSDLLETIRPDLKSDLTAAIAMASTINANADFAAHYLSLTPDLIDAMGRAGAYGSFFDFYLCGVRFKVSTPAGPTYTPFVLGEQRRCKD